MILEQEFFLKILADHIHGLETHIPDSLDWGQVVHYAWSHQVEGIVWHQCHDYIKSKPELARICERLETASMAEAFCYQNNQRALQELEQTLRNQKIRSISLKGLNVAEFYPIPVYRTMGDMDIIVAKDDLNRIEDIMYGLGYQRKQGERVQIYSRGVTLIEVHHQLVNKQNLETAQRRSYFNCIWNHVHEENGIYYLDWNFHFLFLIEHTKQHFSANGVGFRQFLDIAVVAKNNLHLDWAWIRHELETIDMWDFAVNVFAFCKKWWGIDLPFEIAKPDETFYEQSTELVFQNGVFGFENRNASIHLVEKELRVSTLPKSLRLIGIAIKRICIPYNQILTLPYCSFVRGRKYLLPFAWIYRLVYAVIHKKGNIIKTSRDIFNSSEIISVHKKLMDRWGV